MVTRFRNQGWKNESYRHSLSARGIPSGKRAIQSTGRFLKKSVVVMADALKDPDDLERQADDQENMEDAEQIVQDSDGDFDNHEPDEEDFNDDNPDERETFKSRVERELDELRDLVEVRSPTEIFDEVVGDFNLFGDEDGLAQREERIVRLDAEKSHIMDRLNVVNRIREEILSKRFTDQTDPSDNLILFKDQMMF